MGNGWNGFKYTLVIFLIFVFFLFSQWLEVRNQTKSKKRKKIIRKCARFLFCLSNYVLCALDMNYEIFFKNILNLQNRNFMNNIFFESFKSSEEMVVPVRKAQNWRICNRRPLSKSNDRCLCVCVCLGNYFIYFFSLIWFKFQKNRGKLNCWIVEFTQINHTYI